MYRVYDNHAVRLPFVRIKRIELTNFKGVQHGVIELNCAKEFVPYDTKSDILGLYGQNGSGKSSVVQALSAVKGILSGYKLGSAFTRFVDVNADYAIINVEFDFQYIDGRIATVSYEVKIEVKEQKVESASDSSNDQKTKMVIGIFDEVIKTNLYADGTIGRMHTIIDTSSDKLLCNESLEEYYFDSKNNNVRNELIYLKRKLREDSYSFVFAEAVSETFNVRNEEENHSTYYEILAELQLFARDFLYVVGTQSSGLVQLRAGIPIYMPMHDRPLILSSKTVLSNDEYMQVQHTFSQINMVLETLIPDLQLELKAIPTILEDGSEGFFARIMSIRGDRVFPFEYESDGIIKIVSILADYVLAFVQGSVTLVVDEFDSGVFEFLLGELLQIFENSGKGQFIFTSHNLRPLEVINKKFIRFTTADPQNRYYKLKNVGSTNNLRDLYLREVQLGNQDVEIYRRTKSFKIAKALKSAGEGMIPNGEE
jgi:AAA15 family ATPase/GTPase